MKLNQIRNIIAVAERGSLRSAARHLGVAQPAITKSIRELEGELGATLLERHSKGIVLTPMGAIFLQRAKVIQNEVQRASDEISQLKGEVHGKVTIGLSTASHIALLPNALVDFRQRYSETKMEIIESLFSSAEAALKNGTLDCYIGPLSEESLTGELLAEKLFDNNRAIFCRKDHPLAAALSLAELTSADWIATSITVNPAEELGPIFARYNLPEPTIALQAHSALTMIAAAAYSDLLTMLPIQWTEFPWSNNLLQRIHIKERLVAPSMYIVRRANLPLTPAAEFFCDMVRRASEETQRKWRTPEAR